MADGRPLATLPLSGLAGSAHSAIVTEAGELYGWGLHEDVSVAGEGDRPSQIHVPGIFFKMVSVGSAQFAAIDSKGHLYTWGQGTSGRLGHGTDESVSRPKLVEALRDKKISWTGSGPGNNIVAVTENGKVYTWGAGSSGQLGHGSSNLQCYVPTCVQALANEHVICAVAEDHMLALTADGKLFSWGSGSHGRLGHGSKETITFPRQVTALHMQWIVAIAVGNGYSCAVDEKGALYTWGWCANGRLGHGQIAEDVVSPRRVEALKDVRIVSVSAGLAHTAAISDDGNVYSFGAGVSGQLGHGDGTAQYVPKKIEVLSSRRIVAVSCGHGHSVAIDMQGGVYTWGDGAGGRLGHGGTRTFSTPRRLATLKRCRAVSSISFIAPFELPSTRRANSELEEPSTGGGMGSNGAGENQRSAGSSARTPRTPKTSVARSEDLMVEEPRTPLDIADGMSGLSMSRGHGSENRSDLSDGQGFLQSRKLHQELDDELLVDVGAPFEEDESENDDIDFESLPSANPTPPNLPTPPHFPSTIDAAEGATPSDSDTSSSSSVVSRPHDKRESRARKTKEDVVRELLDSRDILIPPRQIKFRRVIGEGSSGIVYLAEFLGTEVAVKRLKGGVSMGHGSVDWQQEFLTLKSLRHPNIVQFMGISLSPKPLCVITEYCGSGSLYDVIHKHKIDIPMRQIHSILKSTASGMSFLHNRTPKIIHRDIKSANLLLTSSWEVKIADFGLSRVKSEFSTQTKTNAVVGTPLWMAPEVMRGDLYGEKCDVYSFAIVMWELFERKIPFEGMDAVQVMFKVVVNHERPKITRVPAAYRSLLEKCWDPDPNKRPSFVEVLDALDAEETRVLGEKQWLDESELR